MPPAEFQAATLNIRIAAGAKLGRFTVEGPYDDGSQRALFRVRDDSTKSGALAVFFPLITPFSEDDKARLKGELSRQRRSEVADVRSAVDVGLVPGGFYAIFPEMTGERLDHALRSGNIPRTIRVFRLAVDAIGPLAQALDQLHAGGVVHGGISPWTVVSQREGEVVLNGLCPLIALSHHYRDYLKTVPKFWPFAAPELLSGSSMDGRADQFSLAQLLCVTIHGEAGTLPIGSLDVPVSVREKPVPWLDEVANASLRQALSPDRRARFPTCMQFVEAIRQSPLYRAADGWQSSVIREQITVDQRQRYKVLVEFYGDGQQPMPLVPATSHVAQSVAVEPVHLLPPTRSAHLQNVLESAPPRQQQASYPSVGNQMTNSPEPPPPPVVTSSQATTVGASSGTSSRRGEQIPIPPPPPVSVASQRANQLPDRPSRLSRTLWMATATVLLLATAAVAFLNRGRLGFVNGLIPGQLAGPASGPGTGATTTGAGVNAPKTVPTKQAADYLKEVEDARQSALAVQANAVLPNEFAEAEQKGDRAKNMMNSASLSDFIAACEEARNAFQQCRVSATTQQQLLVGKRKLDQIEKTARVPSIQRLRPNLWVAFTELKSTAKRLEDAGQTNDAGLKYEAAATALSAADSAARAAEAELIATENPGKALELIADSVIAGNAGSEIVAIFDACAVKEPTWWLQQAEAAAQKLSNEEQPIGFAHLGWAWFQLGQSDKARAAFDAAVAALLNTPNSTESWFAAADCLVSSAVDCRDLDSGKKTLLVVCQRLETARIDRTNSWRSHFASYAMLLGDGAAWNRLAKPLFERVFEWGDVTRLFAIPALVTHNIDPVQTIAKRPENKSLQSIALSAHTAAKLGETKLARDLLAMADTLPREHTNHRRFNSDVLLAEAYLFAGDNSRAEIIASSLSGDAKNQYLISKADVTAKQAKTAEAIDQQLNDWVSLDSPQNQQRPPSPLLREITQTNLGSSASFYRWSQRLAPASRVGALSALAVTIKSTTSNRTSDQGGCGEAEADVPTSDAAANPPSIASLDRSNWRGTFGITAPRSSDPLPLDVTFLAAGKNSVELAIHNTLGDDWVFSVGSLKGPVLHTQLTSLITGKQIWDLREDDQHPEVLGYMEGDTICGVTIEPPPTRRPLAVVTLSRTADKADVAAYENIQLQRAAAIFCYLALWTERDGVHMWEDKGVVQIIPPGNQEGERIVRETVAKIPLKLTMRSEKAVRPDPKAKTNATKPPDTIGFFFAPSVQHPLMAKGEGFTDRSIGDPAQFTYFNHRNNSRTLKWILVTIDPDRLPRAQLERAINQELLRALGFAHRGLLPVKMNSVLADASTFSEGEEPVSKLTSIDLHMIERFYDIGLKPGDMRPRVEDAIKRSLAPLIRSGSAK